MRRLVYPQPRAVSSVVTTDPTLRAPIARLWRGLTTALVSEEPGYVRGHGSSRGGVGMDYMLLTNAGLRMQAAASMVPPGLVAASVMLESASCLIPDPRVMRKAGPPAEGWLSAGGRPAD